MPLHNPGPARQRWSALASAAVIGAATALLAGCLGDDDEDAPPPTVSAAADAATGAWNAALSIDVLSNDSASSGNRTLAAVTTAPVNGSAAITDGRIVYTPRAGFFGTDTLRYRMGTSAGTATAEAEVTVTVEAVLALNGLAIDAPLAQAAVQISGAASATATTDAQGAWQAQVRVSDPQGVVHIRAQGSGAQAHVQLAGAAAAATLAAAADADGKVAAQQVEALTVSHFSTALAALAERAHGGVPGTAAALATAQAAVDADALLNLATLIHLVADEGLALPAGLADTWALAGDATASAALLAQQATADGRAFAQAQARALGAVPAGPPLPTTGMLATYPTASASISGPAVVLAADGTARVSTHLGSRSARWTQDATGLLLTLDAPFSVTDFTSDEDPVTGLQNEVRDDTSAYRLQRLPGGLVAVAVARTRTYTDGSRAGQVQTVSATSDAGSALRLAVDPAAATGLAAADFAVGRRWAGVGRGAQGVGQGASDVLEITAAGSGRALRTGTTHTVEVNGAAFTLVGSDGSHIEYLRLGDAGAGASYFMAFDRSAGADADAVTATPVVLVPQAAAVPFDLALASRSWLFDVGSGTTTQSIVLRADGTGTYLGTPATWQVLADGRVQIVRNRRQFDLGGVTQTRHTRYDWILLNRGADGSIWVLRRVVQEDPAAPVADDAPGPFWFVQRYRDTGPAD